MSRWHLASLCLLLAGCSVSAKQYWKNRGHDILDIIDYDYGTVPGFGAKVELTHFIVPSLGGGEGKEVHKRGRSVETNAGSGMLSLVVFGGEGTSPHSMDMYIAGVRFTAEGERFKDSFRIGPKLYLGYLAAGLYFNFAEFADFFGGLMGFDMMGDDEKPSADDLVWESWERLRASAEFPFPETSSTVFLIQHGKVDESGLLLYAKLVVESYIRSRGPGDEVGLVWFDTFRTDRFPAEGGLQACDDAGKRSLLNALGSITLSAGSPILRGIPAAIEMSQRSTASRKAVVLLLNGDTNASDWDDNRRFSANARDFTALNAGAAEIHVVLYEESDREPFSIDFLHSLAAQNRGGLVRIQARTLERHP